MNVFVTGATGYVGTSVVEALLTKKHTVVGLARSEASAAALKARGCEVVRGQLDDFEVLRIAAQDTDGVIHAGFPQGPDMRIGSEIEQAAVKAMLNVLEGSSKPFLFTSGIGIMGDTGPKDVDESFTLNPPEIGRPRVETEHLVVQAAARGIRSVVLRPGIVFGRGGSGVVRMMIELAKRAGHGRTIGEGANAWSTVHLDDLASLYVLALEKAPAGTLLNVSAGEPVGMRELAAAIGRGIGSTDPVESWPLPEARQMMGVFADGLAEDRRISSQRAQTLLAWHPSGPSLLEDIKHGSYTESLK